MALFGRARRRAETRRRTGRDRDGFWATLSLNIPDFSRYAYTQRDQIIGQAIGLPPTMALYSFIGVAVTSATTIIYGTTIWNPVDVLTRFKNPTVLVVALLALCIATLATNIAANVVSPANDFAHLAPRKISFRVGGFITGIIGILMMPWKLLADPTAYVFTWLIAYSALLGPIGGIRMKMWGAHDAGSKYFLAPVENCNEVVGNIPPGLSVFSVDTLDDAYDAIVAIGKGDTSALSTC